MVSESFAQRLESVQARIQRACARAGRSLEEVRLVAASKTMGPDQVCEAADCGLVLFGENKVQEASAKIPLCPGSLTWHMIGHLQRNKVAAAVQLFDMIHSVDSVRLLQAIDRACSEAGKTLPVLIEVNVAGERSKSGLAPEGLAELLAAARSCMQVNVTGLMTMPPFAEDPEKARPYFRRLRELRDQWNPEMGGTLQDLSMGMTGDFEVAIEEGATMIRVGTALFGVRVRPPPPVEEPE